METFLNCVHYPCSQMTVDVTLFIEACFRAFIYVARFLHKIEEVAVLVHFQLLKLL